MPGAKADGDPRGILIDGRRKAFSDEVSDVLLGARDLP
jgi:hypothetical protein